MPSPAQLRPHFLSPFPRGKAPAAFKSRRVLPAAFERKNLVLLKPAETIELYRAWKEERVRLIEPAPQPVLLEVKINHDGSDYFYQYPVDINYLFSPEWRRDNLSSPFGFFRWMVEMDAALRLNLVAGYENRRLSQSLVKKTYRKARTLEGRACGFKTIDLSLSQILKLNTLLYHLDQQDLLDGFSGNHRQTALAQAAGIANLGQLLTALSNLLDDKGKSWKKKMGYNRIALPAAKVEKLLQALDGEKWKQYKRNNKQIALAKAAGISHLGHFFSALSNLNNGEGKSWTKVLEYNRINLPAAKLEKLLLELAGENWRRYQGNHRQAALAKAAGISHLGQLYSALSNLNNGEGKSWAKVLEYNNINLPAAKLEKLLREIAGENWKQYQGNHQQAALAKAAGISNLGHLFSALSHLNNGEGKSWAKVLGYNIINLPAAKVTLFFAEFINFIKENAFPFISFVRIFQKLAAPACQSRFSEIKNNFSCVKRVVDSHRRADWPENFYKYLLRTLPFLPSSEDPQKAAQDILEYIEREEAMIYQTLKDIPPAELSYDQLHRSFGRYAMPVVKYHGAGLASVRALQRDRTRELFLFDLPLFQMRGVDAVVDTSTLDPLEALLLKEEAGKIAVMEKAMRRLPAAEAEIIKMLHFQGKPIAAVMHALGVDSETVNKRFEAALDHLRDLMEEEF